MRAGQPDLLDCYDFESVELTDTKMYLKVITPRVEFEVAPGDTERAGVLRHLILEGDLSGYGLVNAVTHYSQDVDDYDRATEFEALGGKLIELNPGEWKELAQAEWPGGCLWAALTRLPKWEILLPMRVIAKSSLKKFWDRPGCGDARGPLHSWYAEAVKATWASPQDVKDQYASASICGNNRVVFNVGGNKYRLVVEMQYRAGIVWVKFVGTHAQYDRIDVENVNEY